MRIDKGKSRPSVTGELNGRAKITENQAKYIYSQKGLQSSPRLAAIFEIDQSQVSLIWRKLRWKHIHGST